MTARNGRSRPLTTDGPSESTLTDAPILRILATAIYQVAYDAAGYDVFAENKVLEAAERSQLREFVGRWGS